MQVDNLEFYSHSHCNVICNVFLCYFTDMYNILINLDNTYKQYHQLLASLGGHDCLEAGGEEAADGGLEAGAA